MKCPKCAYLGFESVDRCRNCGYEFSLSQSVPLPDLSIRAEPERAESPVELPLFGPPIPDDEPLITKASPPRPPLAVRRGTPEVGRVRAEPPLRTPSLDLALDEPDPPPSPAAGPADRVPAD